VFVPPHHEVTFCVSFRFFLTSENFWACTKQKWYFFVIVSEGGMNIETANLLLPMNQQRSTPILSIGPLVSENEVFEDYAVVTQSPFHEVNIAGLRASRWPAFPAAGFNNLLTVCKDKSRPDLTGLAFTNA
jgi:hypothetical protein